MLFWHAGLRFAPASALAVLPQQAREHQHGGGPQRREKGDRDVKAPPERCRLCFQRGARRRNWTRARVELFPDKRVLAKAGEQFAGVRFLRFIGADKIRERLIPRERLLARGKVRQQRVELAARQQVLEWYARGIGLVKRETRTSQGSDAAGSIEQLQSYSGLAR